MGLGKSVRTKFCQLNVIGIPCRILDNSRSEVNEGVDEKDIQILHHKNFNLFVLNEMLE